MSSAPSSSCDVDPTVVNIDIVDLPVLDGDDVATYIKTGYLETVNINQTRMGSPNTRAPSLSSKLKMRMESSKEKGDRIITNQILQKSPRKFDVKPSSLTKVSQSLDGFSYVKSNDGHRKRSLTDEKSEVMCKARKQTGLLSDSDGHLQEQSDKVPTMSSNVTTSQKDNLPTFNERGAAMDSTTTQNTSPNIEPCKEVQSGSCCDTEKTDKLNGENDDSCDSNATITGDTNVEDPRDAATCCDSDQVLTTSVNSSAEKNMGKSQLIDTNNECEGTSEETRTSGVVQMDIERADGLKTYRNSVGVTFVIDLSDEAREYIHTLVEDARKGKPPTVSRVKYLTITALEQLIRFNDRPLYNLNTHPELAATVTDYIKNGVPPRCPKCKRGSLRFSNGKKKHGKKYYWCPGYSPNGYHFYGCNFRAERELITRIPFAYPD